MQRRDFLRFLSAGALLPLWPSLALALTPARSRRLLVLVELKGGNDGLNTVVPYASADYYRLRPTIAIDRQQVLPLSGEVGLHPALAPLMPLWQEQELAVLQGVGYPDPNLSHFRSIEIWDTASASNQFLTEGWLTRAFALAPLGPSYAADGVVLGSQNLGPLDGGSRAVVLNDPVAFARQAQLAQDDQGASARTPALAHVLKVEQDIRQAARQFAALAGPAAAGTGPKGGLAQSVQTLSHLLSGGVNIAVARLTLTGFDTHGGQNGTQQRLLAELADGLALLRTNLQAQGRWDETLVMTYAEFGRRPRENGNRGTDHGTANSHFMLGGRVRGGLYGAAPDLRGVTDGNLPYVIDFRQVYATVLEGWWGEPAKPVLGSHFSRLPLLRV